MIATITESIHQTHTLTPTEIENMNIDLMQARIHFYALYPKPESPLFIHFMDQILDAVVETASMLNYDSKTKGNKLPILFGNGNHRATY